MLYLVIDKPKKRDHISNLCCFRLMFYWRCCCCCHSILDITKFHSNVFPNIFIWISHSYHFLSDCHCSFHIQFATDKNFQVYIFMCKCKFPSFSAACERDCIYLFIYFDWCWWFWIEFVVSCQRTVAKTTTTAKRCQYNRKCVSLSNRIPMDKEENEQKNEEQNKLFTPIFACSCVKMAGAVVFPLTTPKMYIWNEKNFAYRGTIRVCSFVIQSRLKCNFCSISCGTFLNVSMHTHIECSNILELAKPSWEYEYTINICLFVRSFGCRCVLFWFNENLCLFVPGIIANNTRLTRFLALLSFLKYWEREDENSKSMLIVLSWTPCETKFDCGWATFNFRSPFSLSHHEHV